eukprot:CAMPEP_0172210530 /NCGR_PEP_ID=MMETSP1050-20130122/35813_1 /TAXON_ID=233186 /ORGANISM="Cryptomonas curvata, Strain CCAP979/52" /LENGTH=84 /DNA_ID=CAMNT_0012890711 /DNA_START=402 /DNA_END=656 /DNA_ORIENTATION=+
MKEKSSKYKRIEGTERTEMATSYTLPRRYFVGRIFGICFESSPRLVIKDFVEDIQYSAYDLNQVQASLRMFIQEFLKDISSRKG